MTLVVHDEQAKEWVNYTCCRGIENLEYMTLDHFKVIKENDGDKVCDKEIMMNDDNLESNLLTASLLKRCLVYMVV